MHSHLDASTHGLHAAATSAGRSYKWLHTYGHTVGTLTASAESHPLPEVRLWVLQDVSRMPLGQGAQDTLLTLSVSSSQAGT